MLLVYQMLPALCALVNLNLHTLFTIPLMAVAVAAPLNARTPSETGLGRSALLAQPPAPVRTPITLKVVTFNIHDLAFVAADREARMRAIGEVLTDLDPDIVGFQEAFIAKDRAILLESLSGSRLKHHCYFPSATVGSGLLTASAYPIVEALFHRYERGGKWCKPYHGDWWAGKGVALTRIELPDGIGYLDFYNTHAHARYDNHAEYAAVHEAQMRELAAFLEASATRSSPALLAGDLNCRAGSPDFEMLVKQGGLMRMMAVPSGVDHIFAVTNPAYAFVLVDGQTIEKEIPVWRGMTRLSDHSGYLSVLRITPSQ